MDITIIFRLKNSESISLRYSVKATRTFGGFYTQLNLFNAF